MDSVNAVRPVAQEKGPSDHPNYEKTDAVGIKTAKEEASTPEDVVEISSRASKKSKNDDLVMVAGPSDYPNYEKSVVDIKV